MIKITPTETTGLDMARLGYISGRGGIARIVLPVTRYLRAVNAERYLASKERLLDIGCGDGYFLRRSGCTERYGLDKRTGDEVVDTLPFPDEHFDFVTMLAVIEHIAQPEAIISDIHRVLKPGGRFVFTTPKRQAERLIRLYVRDIDEHETYYDLDRVRRLAGSRFRLGGYHNLPPRPQPSVLLREIRPPMNPFSFGWYRP